MAGTGRITATKRIAIMDTVDIRSKSLRVVRELGYGTNEQLPLLEYTEITRSVTEVVDRLLGMHCVAAAAYGFNRELAVNWLNTNLAWAALTDDERHFLLTGEGSTQDFKFQIEGMWALYWACGLTRDEFSFGFQCPRNFVTRLPDLKASHDASVVRDAATLRDAVELVQMADIAYCIHWSQRQSALGTTDKHLWIPEYVIRERRHALDWILECDDWETVALDT